MFGSFGAGFGSFGAGVGGLLPSFTNITSWLRSPTTDGKTLANNKGTDANLTGVNCLNLDGTDDEVNTGYNPQGGNLIIEATIKPDSVTSQRTIFGVNGNSGFWLRIENGQWDLYSRNAFIFQNSTVITPTVGNIYDIRVEYDYSTEDWIAKVKLSTDSTYTTIGTGNRLPPIVGSANVILGQKGTSGYFDGEFYSFKLTEGGNVKVDYPFAEGSGTKTFDVSGSGNHGVITGATWTTEDGIESWNHEYGFSGSALFDGTDDYIETGVVANDNYTLEFRAKLENDDAYMGSFNLVDRFFIGRNTSNFLRLGYKSFNNVATVSSSIYSKLTTYKIQGGKGFVDGVEVIDSGVSPTGATVGELYLGARNLNGTADSFTQGDLEYYRIYDDNGVLVRDFVPSPNGLYDKVNGVYYSNDGTGTITVKRIPALNTKTTQVATFDGVADKVDFASALLDSASTFTVRFDIHKFERTAGNFHWVVGGLAGANFGLNKGGVMFYRAGDNTYLEFDGTGNTTDTSNLDLDGKSIVVKGSNDVIELFIDTVSYGTVTANSGQGVYTASRYGQGYVNASHNFKGSLSRVALWNTANDGQDLSTALVNHEFQSDIGTNTIQDLSGNNNDGNYTGAQGALEKFWGTRVADTAGSLVSADYASGNTTISNPGGFVHNGSECGVDMVSNDKTATELFAIVNSNATETFVRKDNGNIVQILDYSAPLTGDDLTRTRNYVG